MNADVAVVLPAQGDLEFIEIPELLKLGQHLLRRLRLVSAEPARAAAALGKQQLRIEIPRVAGGVVDALG